MTLRLFEGPAGCGKTTRLVSELAATLAHQPLQEDQRVLALTRMHGSRRRLLDRLTRAYGHRHGFDCLTIDSFAWRLLNRWRSLGGRRFGAEAAEGDYDTVCRRAGELLEWEVVSRWVGRRFPIVLVDEMQDSKGGQLEVIKGLASVATCLVAADEFQDLDGGEVNEAVFWARRAGEVETLAGNFRTATEGLLSAAAALRDGSPVPGTGTNFRLFGAAHHNIGATYVSNSLTWWRSGDVAILSPVRRETSPWVRDLIARVEAGPIGKFNSGPHPIQWESSSDDECDAAIADLGLPIDPEARVRAEDLEVPHASPGSSALGEWLEKQRRVGGKADFSAQQIRDRLRWAHHRLRAHTRNDSRGTRAMTVHQAKNREFDCVVVLWPYQVAGDESRLRRLLYNAITRAKRAALVVVQDPQRLDGPPFKAAANPGRPDHQPIQDALRNPA